MPDQALSPLIRRSLPADGTMRLHTRTATIEKGFVHLPDEARWLADTPSRS
jgi:hypothetical protein